MKRIPPEICSFESLQQQFYCYNNCLKILKILSLEHFIYVNRKMSVNFEFHDH